jgi:hypothetical protein
VHLDSAGFDAMNHEHRYLKTDRQIDRQVSTLKTLFDYS